MKRKEEEQKKMCTNVIGSCLHHLSIKFECKEEYKTSEFTFTRSPQRHFPHSTALMADLTTDGLWAIKQAIYWIYGTQEFQKNCPYPSQLCDGEEKVNLKDLRISPEAAIKLRYNLCHCFKGHSPKTADEMCSHHTLIPFVHCWKKYVDISWNIFEFSLS